MKSRISVFAIALILFFSMLLLIAMFPLSVVDLLYKWHSSQSLLDLFTRFALFIHTLVTTRNGYLFIILGLAIPSAFLILLNSSKLHQQFATLATISRPPIDPILRSPIERQFYQMWKKRYSSIRLVPQYKIDRYRVDFAHLPTKTVIELDGFIAHSSAEQIAHDRQRQRYLEDTGWHVRRYGGKEIYHNVEHCVIDAHNYIIKAKQPRLI